MAVKRKAPLPVLPTESKRHKTESCFSRHMAIHKPCPSMESPSRLGPPSPQASPCSCCAQGRGRPRSPPEASTSGRTLDSLPAEVLLIVLSSLAKKATIPSDLAAAAMTCRALREASSDPSVLASLDASALVCPADAFSPAYHSFLRRCAAAGNPGASYALGMIEFYCLGNRREGVRALVRASKAGHSEALYSLAIIHFNGSGTNTSNSNGSSNSSTSNPNSASNSDPTSSSRNHSSGTATATESGRQNGAGGIPEKKLSVGVLLCSSAAQQGHVQALRELGHCFQDGYGIARDEAEGRRLLLEANLREFLAQQAPPSTPGTPSTVPLGAPFGTPSGVPLGVSSGGLEEGVSGSDMGAGAGDGSPCNPEAVAQVRRLEALLQSAKSQAQAQAPCVAAGGEPGAAEHEGEAGREAKGSADPHEEGSPLAPPQPQSQSQPQSESQPQSQPQPQSESQSQSQSQPQSQSQSQSQPQSQGHDAASLAFLQSMCQCLRPLISDWGSAPSCPAPSPVHTFLQRWHHLQGSADGGSTGANTGERLKVCASRLCGRVETRPREFRCCALCSSPRYCSRACQASDWRTGHMEACPGAQH